VELLAHASRAGRFELRKEGEKSMKSDFSPSFFIFEAKMPIIYGKTEMVLETDLGSQVFTRANTAMQSILRQIITEIKTV
jgi:hypothetical protein